MPVVCRFVRGYITDPTAPAGLRLTNDLPDPEPTDDEVVTSLTDEVPFHLVLDGVGGEVTTEAIRRIAPHGHLACYGNPAAAGSSSPSPISTRRAGTRT